MIKKIFYVIFLFISTSVYSIAQEVADNITINKNHIYSLDRDTEKIHPEYRAMLFSKTLENILNDPQEKSISIEYMTSLQKKANKSMKNGQYEQAYRYYYEAALYYPKVLLFFSAAQAKLMEVLARKYIYSVDVLFVLENYQLGIAFYQYEKEHNVSISMACFNEMQRQAKCLQDIYEKYKKDENNIEISKNEILYCK
jgi:hypothetical protein